MHARRRSRAHEHTQEVSVEGAPVLEVERLSVTFGDGGEGVIVDGVSFRVAAAECIAIVGESGSGKSMTLKALLGLQPASLDRSGGISLQGRRLDGLADADMRLVRGRRIGLVPQDPFTSLNPVRRIGVQLADVFRAHFTLSRDEIRERSLELIRAVGLSDPERRLRQFPHELSGGMRQRAVIALALACAPHIILADEPTTALDVTVQAQILSLLDELRSTRGVSVILVTHDLGLVRERASRVVVMYGGQVVEAGPTAEVFDHPKAPYTRALLESLPSLTHAAGEELPELAGNPPDPAEALAGCRFEPRCARALADCANEPPKLEPAGEDRKLRCFNPVPAPAETPGAPR